MATPFAIHNVRFFDLAPRSAHCLAYSRSRCLLALSRADNSIEIWHLGHAHDGQKKKRKAAPVLQRVIPAQETQGSVEALVWASGVNTPTLISSDHENLDDEDYEVKTSYSKKLKKLKKLEGTLVFPVRISIFYYQHLK